MKLKNHSWDMMFIYPVVLMFIYYLIIRNWLLGLTGIFMNIEMVSVVMMYVSILMVVAYVLNVYNKN